jgi:hypothetical protein
MMLWAMQQQRQFATLCDREKHTELKVMSYVFPNSVLLVLDFLQKNTLHRPLQQHSKCKPLLHIAEVSLQHSELTNVFNPFTKH